MHNQAFRRSGVQAFRRKFLFFSFPPSCLLPYFVKFFDWLTAPRGSYASVPLRVFWSPYDEYGDTYVLRKKMLEGFVLSRGIEQKFKGVK